MQKITFEDLPSTNTPINATNLNAIQTNAETAINSVVESGSNANGNWIKYSDGTMICHRIATGTVTINQTWGSVVYGDVTTEYSFAQTFTEVPNVQLRVYPTGSPSFWVGAGDVVPTTTTSKRYWI